MAPAPTAFETAPALEPTRKRRQGYPSETQVRRGRRFVHGDKELVEKLGRNDPCPCGSARRFKRIVACTAAATTAPAVTTTSAIEAAAIEAAATEAAAATATEVRLGPRLNAAATPG
ncbi:SEC-C domain-containing protein [Lysobacter sp. BMK333-48F3]|nr:SEC-C domain-containing protein [Lysobacter sp. BMK333-48F3]